MNKKIAIYIFLLSSCVYITKATHDDYYYCPHTKTAEPKRPAISERLSKLEDRVEKLEEKIDEIKEMIAEKKEGEKDEE